MTTILGIPTSNRQASPQFARYGENSRLAHNVKDLAIRMCLPLISFYTYAFSSILPWIIATTHLETALCVVESIPIKINDLPKYFDPSVIFTLVTDVTLPADFITRHNLIEKKPGGKYKFGYVTTRKRPMSQLPVLLAGIQALGVTVHQSAGIKDTGFTTAMVKSITNLGRVVQGYLASQMNTVRTQERTDVLGYEYSNLKCSVKKDHEGPMLIFWDDDNSSFEVGKDAGFEDGFWYGFMRSDNDLSGPEESATKDDVTEENAHLFRFIPFTFPGDSGFFADLLYNRFSKLYSGNDAVSKKMIESVTNEIPPLSKTIEGSEILFILYIISLAITCNGFVQLIRDSGVLVGASLITNQPMWRGEHLVNAVDASSIRSTVASWITSTQARQVVADMLSGLFMMDGVTKVKIDADAIPTSYRLLVEINLRRRATFLPEDLKNVLPFLGYSKEYKAANAEGISECINCLVARNAPVTLNFFVESGIFTSGTPVMYALLASFGENSISFLNPGGKAIDLYLQPSEDPKVKVEKEVIKQSLVVGKRGKKEYKDEKIKVRFWDRICVSRVPISAAYKDFATMIETGVIHQLTVYDSKAYGNIDIHPVESETSVLMAALRLLGKRLDFFEKRDKGKKVAFVPAEKIKDSALDITDFDVGF